MQSRICGGDTNPGKRVKILSHDLMSLLKRFAYQESFSRDSKGGGPEHNMNLIPYTVQLIAHCLKISNHSANIISHSENETEKEKSMTFI